MNDQVIIKPSIAKGRIQAPPSKSETHRAIISAALAKGTSIIDYVILSDDIKATISAIEDFGVTTSYKNNQLTIKSKGNIPYTDDIIDCNESGSTLRFMIPLFALTNHQTTITGKPSLLKRPLNVYKHIFEEINGTFIQDNNQISIKAKLTGRNYQIPGNISSQFITGLLFSLPLIESDSTITIIGDFESKSYVDLTLSVLASFGIQIKETKKGFYIPGNQSYQPTNYTISGDYSQAAYFLVAGALSQDVLVNQLDHETLQGDKAIIDVLKIAGAQLTETSSGFRVKKSALSGQTINIENCPDLGPIIALLCSVSQGKSLITGASRLRIKESDRIVSTVETLKILGAKIDTLGDDIIIEGVPYLLGGTIDSFNDHRIAMMASIASLVSKNKIVINRAWAINKSYPHFYNDLASLGVMIEGGESQ